MPSFLADECFTGAIYRALLAAGFDVVRVSDVMPGAEDARVLEYAYRENRVILTEDTDFGELVEGSTNRPWASPA